MSPLPPADQVRGLAREILSDEQFVRGRTERALFDQFWGFINDLAGLQDSSPVLYWLFLGGLTAILVAIFVHAGWVVYRAVGPGAARRNLSSNARSRRRLGDPDRAFGAALARAEEGDYRAALPLLYFSVLLELDRRGLLHLDPAETNREAASRLRLPELRRLARRLAALADRAMYSHRRCTETQYQDGLDLRRRVLEGAP